MGYRNYIGSINKRKYNGIKSMTKEELNTFFNKEDIFDDMGVRDFVDKELYELGKYVDFPIPKGSQKKFFKDSEVSQWFNNDYEIYIVTKEFLETVIIDYQNKIKEYYTEYFKPFMNENGRFLKNDILPFLSEYDESNNNETFTVSFTKDEILSLYKIIQHSHGLKTEWCSLDPINLHVGDKVTSSWKYEYSIFELVKIYKTFDWSRNYMVYYGH